MQREAGGWRRFFYVAAASARDASATGFVPAYLDTLDVSSQLAASIEAGPG